MNTIVLLFSLLLVATLFTQSAGGILGALPMVGGLVVGGIDGPVGDPTGGALPQASVSPDGNVGVSF
ncbi:hypothetical protein QR680_015727 [Steinernema hermaphroditum]|uniref:Secreted protein n=1 Tax=Steinernema hermaphroditum TaxID=289476 RepID=A0AA39LL35_9BILA|nr:hypothetical protein QR680_015727 [Steinernema hermaphroditum]